MDVKKLCYWISTVLMCGIFLFSAGMYFSKYEIVKGFFEELNFPVWIIYPLAVAKILGVIAVLSNMNKTLKEWAYAGFFFDAVLATGAHHFAGHGMIGLSFYAIILVLLSKFLDKYRA